LIAMIWLGLRWPRPIILAIAPGLAMLLLCIAIGAGKPAEFARFLLLPGILFAIATAALAAALASHRLGWGILVTVLALAVMRSPSYLHSFYVDARFQHESRHLAGQYLHAQAPPSDVIGVVQVPAPYATPPLDFAHRSIHLLPSNDVSLVEQQDLPQWLVLTADDATVYRDAWWQPHYQLIRAFAAEPLQLSRITWANKPVFVYRRTD
jgi:hypothetical protein